MMKLFSPVMFLCALCEILSVLGGKCFLNLMRLEILTAEVAEVLRRGTQRRVYFHLKHISASATGRYRDETFFARNENKTDLRVEFLRRRQDDPKAPKQEV